MRREATWSGEIKGSMPMGSQRQSEKEEKPLMPRALVGTERWDLNVK